MSYRLNQPFPSEVIYNGQTFSVDMAFDNILDVFDCLEDESINERVRVDLILALLCDEQPKTLDLIQRYELLGLIFTELIQENVSEIVEYDVKGNPIIPTKVSEDEKKEPETYSLTYDASYIWTSFQQAYHIDLEEQIGEMHWHKFKYLLRDLPDDTMFARVVEIRQRKLSDVKDMKERTQLKKLKKQYKLPNQEIEADPRFED